MADPVAEVTEATVKLVLDDVTGEMVTRNELKKRTQKRTRKAANQARAKEAAKNPKPATPKPKTEEPTQLDPDAMFKQGFLSDVYKERPVKPVITRFPPEPNGYLHLGHAKAIAIDFGFARYHGGETILRFDDTNPDEEEEVYFEWIIKIVKWLGFTPSAITYSSDYFQRLFDLAKELIKKEKAYVCHCGEAEIKLQRGGKEGKEGPRYRCKHAEQDVETNLQKFQDMHDGKYEPQTAFLRMKQDIENGNPQMWDLAAYRIPKKQKQHVRAPTWKMFPTYDFTHCLVDSFENITHSLCTTEFILSRESYEWLNKSLEVYEPMQREFGRLNVSGTIMSKRALKKLVEGGIVRGWDDPRLYTLIAIRRRGIPPGALLAFVNELGVTTAKTVIQIVRFEQTVRRYLENTVPRVSLVLDPVPVTIEDVEETVELDVPYSPKDAKFGTHKVRFTKTVYIDRSDFREEDIKGYFRLAPGKTVGLLNAPHPIKATSFTKDETTGKVTGISAVYDKETKPKTYIQWVPDNSIKLEVRIHSPLFKSDDPTTVEGGFLNDINPNSETVYTDALIEEGFKEIRQKAPWPVTAGEEGSDSGPETVRFQALRVGYFAMDSDSTDDKIVLNRIVSLKEDSGKNN
ncbi:tRNA synthetases class I, catalytic domain-containing protein [Thelonectria olida]|uniref:glutamine--tRNA ligase n=1 Tax=Thelonectria olida TaxID=1576542 RepID=A0A9P9AT34_9HYPO|nr:tRNA synthetases class I, catalytic domain-containing protein [Thelonectria olida]